jgi:predicted ATPase
MDLVGRQGGLAAIARALGEMRDGGSRVIAVLGEAGIGKSALLDAVAPRATGVPEREDDENALTRVYAKLGARSRTQSARAFG